MADLSLVVFNSRIIQNASKDGRLAEMNQRFYKLNACFAIKSAICKNGTMDDSISRKEI